MSFPDAFSNITRRDTLRMSGVGFLRVSLLISSCISCARNPSGLLDWNHLIDILTLLADDQLATRDQDHYVGQVSRVLRRLNVKDPNILTAIDATRGKVLLSPYFSTLYEVPRTFQLASVVFDKGQEVPPHDHPDMAGVLGCIAGRVSVWNYERVGHYGDDNTCLLREVSASTLTHGATSALTSTRGNIHTLRAEERSHLLDVFTPPYDDGRRLRTHWYAVTPIPMSNNQRILRATTVAHTTRL